MSRLSALATLLTVATLLQGCSVVVATSIENEQRNPPPDVTPGTLRNAVEAELGNPEKISRAADGSVVATYKYRVYPPNTYGKPDDALWPTFWTLGLAEIVTFPMGLIMKGVSFLQSTVHRVDVTYGADGMVIDAGPWRPPHPLPRSR